MKRCAVAVVFGLGACGSDSKLEAPGESSATAYRWVELEASPILEPAREAREILEAKGGGLAVFDANADGLLDVFLPGAARLEQLDGQGASLLLGDGNLGFRRAQSTPWRGFGMGTAVGDVDGDGRDDVFVAAFAADALLFGEPSGLEARMAGVEHEGWSSGAAFADVDLDGDLDLAVARYVKFDPGLPPEASSFFGTRVFGGPAGLEGERNGLYENTGDGTFRDRSDVLEVGPARATLGVLAMDLDRDGALDLYFGNDSQPNRVYFGQTGEPFTFEEAGEPSGLARNGDGHGQATMGSPSPM